MGTSSAKAEQCPPNRVNSKAIERFFVDEFIDRWGDEVPERLVLDFDPTDIELHGRQEG
ncbi:MAG: hypothetical protein GY901_03705, partial [Actinomycetia bacterium]|nr:hypothetical protein [Actinomycetes bacterium]